MTMENITLRLSSDLIKKAKELTGDANDLQAFITDAIIKEIERRQMPKAHQNFWATVTEIREQLADEGLEIHPDDIWGDIRDSSPGREVIL
ncbi:hypothetical protein AM10699_67780 (plasmid) [Acaryochloris marina MBIC10699]|nr:hypothetical protein AM10699_67780 [Acaryochloris marina MBIC10699]